MLGYDVVLMVLKVVVEFEVMGVDQLVVMASHAYLLTIAYMIVDGAVVPHEAWGWVDLLFACAVH